MAAFQYSTTEIASIANELNKKLVENSYINNLDQQKYFVYLRGVARFEAFKTILQGEKEKQIIETFCAKCKSYPL